MRKTPCASRRFNGQHLLILKQSRIFPCDCIVTVIGRGCYVSPVIGWVILHSAFARACDRHT